MPIERTAQFGGPQRFDLLGNVIDDPCNFSVHADSEIKNLKELAAYAKANPGKVTVGSSGIGSDDHLLMLMFERAAGVKMTHVPFKGAADAHRARSRSPSAQSTSVRRCNPSRAARRCATSANSAPRTTVAPELPTRASKATTSSFPRCAASPRRGLPADIRERLVKAVAQAANDPEFKEKATGVFAPLRYLSPADFDRVIKEAEVGFRQL